MTIAAAVYGERFSEILGRVDRLLVSGELADTHLKPKIDQDLKELKERGFLTIAFIGEYSAGKSTLISALTGRRDLKISADIATDTCKEYEWNGVRLVDTPGLWTERKDHDAKTYAAIAKADLLVFCLTYSLFDTTTLSNFNKLAFAQNYQTKMLLLVNKMSGEAGDVEERIGHYTSSLKTSLLPHDINSFPVVFCDARDQFDGIDEDDAELQAMSRFDILNDQLNQFIAKKGAVARLDTPLRIVLTTLDEVVVACTRNQGHDKQHALLMRKFSGVVMRERRSLRTSLEAEVVALRSNVQKIGHGLAQEVGVSNNLESEVEHAGVTISSMYEHTAREMESIIEKAVVSLQDEIGKELNSPLMSMFLEDINVSSIKELDVPAANGSSWSQDMKNTVGLFNKISTTIGLAGVKGGLTAIEASKTGLAAGIRTVGKWVGFKFKPWQAANWAKGLSNAMPYVGVVLSLLSVASDVASEVEEAKNEKKLQDAKKELIDSFFNASVQMTDNLNSAIEESLDSVFGQVEELLIEMKESYESELGKTNSTIQEVVEIRLACHALLREI